MSINQKYEIQALSDKIGHFIRIRSLNKAKHFAVYRTFTKRFPSGKEVNAEINKMESGSNPPLNTEVAPETLERPTPVQTGESGEAEGLLIQAGLLEEDAKALMEDAESKRTLAYSIDPSLAPKKGPGRPKKTS